MTTQVSNIFSINGVIDTNQPVMRNIQTIANACSSWVTYDVNEGKWGVVINREGSSVKSFNDSNIIGSINIRGTGVFELYNRVELDFPNKDILDQKDNITYTIFTGDRFPNEIDNTLNFSLDCINNPVQAEILALRELKQSRVDKIIEFRTDFSSLGLSVGDLIDVTSSVYGYNQKIFRVLSINEEDGDDNNIVLNVTAFEYDADVYNISGITKQVRTRENGIIASTTNTAVVASENKAGLPMDLSGVAKGLGLTLAFNALTGKWEFGQSGPQVNIFARYAVITWTFNFEYNEVDIGGTPVQVGRDDGGRDLDIRAAVVIPDTGVNNDVGNYLGYTVNSYTQWPLTGTPYIAWAGDNTGVGAEQVVVDLDALRSAYPGQQYFVLECRGNWYGTPGSTPVGLVAALYQGGTASINSTDKLVDVTGFTSQKTVTGVEKYLNSNFGATADPTTGLDGSTAPGDFMGYFVFDAINNTAQITSDLTSIGY